MLLVLAMLMTGCGSSTGSSTEEDDAETSSQVVVALWAEPETLCGGFTPNIYSGLLSRQIFDTLLVYEDDGTYAPMLATEWEYSEDGKDLTFTLRDDVSFHNGEKMTADDVVFSYNTIIEAGIADSMTNAMDYMEKVDDSHVKLVFKFVYGPGLKACASFNMPIFSKSAYEADPDGFARNPVGTGPYMFSEWKSENPSRWLPMMNIGVELRPFKPVLSRASMTTAPRPWLSRTDKSTSCSRLPAPTRNDWKTTRPCSTPRQWASTPTGSISITMRTVFSPTRTCVLP